MLLNRPRLFNIVDIHAIKYINVMINKNFILNNSKMHKKCNIN